MPGAYAHITLVNLLRVPAQLDSIPDFPNEAKIAVMRFFKFCELGAVSPDYPYLAATTSGAAEWADLMHYKRTGDVIKAGIRLVAAMPPGSDRNKVLSWLLGYSAHVATDVTIHPVVELKVGTYAENQRDHRVCELHQDAYIFQRLNIGQVGLAEHLNAGIWDCCDAPGSGRLDPAIATLWKAMLKECHPEAYKVNEPDPHKWHSGFRTVVDKVEEGGKLFPAARHLAVNCGFTYPNPDEVDSRFIANVRVPGTAGHLHYDDVFDKAVSSVKTVWSLIGKGVFAGDQAYVAGIGNWNLDTGKDELNRYAFWS